MIWVEKTYRKHLYIKATNLSESFRFWILSSFLYPSDHIEVCMETTAPIPAACSGSWLTTLWHQDFEDALNAPTRYSFLQVESLTLSTNLQPQTISQPENCAIDGAR